LGPTQGATVLWATLAPSTPQLRAIDAIWGGTFELTEGVH